jgi:hypothetical protein
MQTQPESLGFDPFVEEVLAAEVHEQCKFALMAHAHLTQAQSDPATPIQWTWYSLQNFLVAAANISKLLWGTKPATKARRTRLRIALGVDDTFAIRDRNLRNDFEHFDERVEDKCTKTHIYIGRNVGPAGMIAIGDPDDHFQHYDPTTGQVTFWTHSVSVPAVLKEIELLLPRARAIAER